MFARLFSGISTAKKKTLGHIFNGIGAIGTLAGGICAALTVVFPPLLFVGAGLAVGSGLFWGLGVYLHHLADKEEKKLAAIEKSRQPSLSPDQLGHSTQQNRGLEHLLSLEDRERADYHYHKRLEVLREAAERARAHRQEHNGIERGL